jgi:putative Holliday junction resolvase
LDVGDKRIGVAVSDPSERIAQGIEQISWNKQHPDKGIGRIKELIHTYKARKLVVGQPLGLRGEKGAQAQKVEKFVNCLRSKINIPIVLIDESLSTAAAEKILREARLTLSKRKKVKDKLAAAIILKDYLEWQRGEMGDSAEKLDSL